MESHLDIRAINSELLGFDFVPSGALSGGMIIKSWRIIENIIGIASALPKYRMGANPRFDICAIASLEAEQALRSAREA